MDGAQFLRVFLAFGFVLGLMLGLAWLARHFKLDEKLQGMRRTTKGSLALVDSLPLDAKRRLVVVAHADSHYLLLLGPGGDLLIETRPGGGAVHAPA